MSLYCRYFVPGGTFFFTVVTAWEGTFWFSIHGKVFSFPGHWALGRRLLASAVVCYPGSDEGA